MFQSEAVTEGVRVHVESVFDAGRSDLSKGLWFFLYTVTIHNGADEPVQLRSRYWRITDEAGRVEEVRGPGVVGEQPRLEPGQSFQYTSGCPLTTATGTMEGSYRMVTDDGRGFDVAVAPFVLSEPYLVN